MGISIIKGDIRSPKRSRSTTDSIEASEAFDLRSIRSETANEQLLGCFFISGLYPSPHLIEGAPHSKRTSMCKNEDIPVGKT